MLPTHLATTLSALARRMCYGSSFSGRERVPATTELMAEAAPLWLVILSCFFALIRFHRHLKDKVIQK